MTKLAQLKTGSIARIIQYDPMKERANFINLGLFTGDKILVVREAKWGSPIVIRHGSNQLLAIRSDLARDVEVEKL